MSTTPEPGPWIERDPSAALHEVADRVEWLMSIEPREDDACVVSLHGLHEVLDRLRDLAAGALR